MADIKQPWGTSTPITILLASLAEGVGRQCLALDNASDKWLDVLVQLQIKLQTGTPASEKQIRIYVAGSEDGTNYTDNYTGTEGAITLRDPTNLIEVKPIQAPTAGGLLWKSHPFSIAACFGGVMPRKWGIAVVNKTNIAFSATEGDHVKSFSGIYGQST